VQHTTIINTLWHGISVGPCLVNSVLANLLFQDFQIINPGKAGIYFVWGNVAIDHGFVVGAQGGGIVAFQVHGLHVTNCNLLSNKEAGVLMQGIHPTLGQVGIVIQGNTIQNTQSIYGLYGDGIMATLFPAEQSLVASLLNNQIIESERAGSSSFGADLSLAGNNIFCSPFDLDGEFFPSPSGIPYKFNDLVGNLCGCPRIPLEGGGCEVTSSTLTPPPPVGELQ